MHLFSKEHHLLGGFAFIAEGIPVALGSAFTSRYKRDALGDASSNAVTAAFFGDGTCNNGQFFECMNMAPMEAADPVRGGKQQMGHRHGP